MYGKLYFEYACVLILALYFCLFPAVRFEVTVKEERLAKLCDIVGKHTLCISDRELAFEEVGTRRIKYAFHFAWLRKFGRQAEVFLFECGRNCPNGEGEVRCISSDCSKIHDIVTANSCSAAQKAKEVSRAKSMAVQQEAPASTHSHPTYHTLPSHFDSNIGAPSLVTNTARKHPGQIKHPELIPIAPKTSSSSITPPTPKKSVPDSRKSVFSSKDSLKKHGPVSDDFTKELENKILTHPPGEESTSHTEHDGKSHKDFKRSKEKKKSDKEEKKGKNGRKSDKEDKKEKDEKKSKGFFGSKKKEKVERESKANVPDKLNLYEDPDALIENSNSKENKVDEHDTYDEAISSPVRNTLIPEPVEYAQPFTRKTTNFQSVDTVMYSDVKDVEDRAWVRHGQENEIHEEDYLNIKNARELKEKEANPPPLPQKLYEFEDETYNTLDLGKTPKANIATTQNIYGTAGAKAVGNLDTVVVPEVTKSESEGSSGDIYEPSDGEEPPLYEGYEAPEAVKSKAKTLSQKQQIQPALYEEIPSPPAVNPIRTKQSKFQESVYDEVS